MRAVTLLCSGLRIYRAQAAAPGQRIIKREVLLQTITLHARLAHLPKI
jgi:hypothetical protein